MNTNDSCGDTRSFLKRLVNQAPQKVSDVFAVLYAQEHNGSVLFSIDKPFAQLRPGASPFSYGRMPVSQQSAYELCRALEEQIKSVEGDLVEDALLTRLKGAIRAERRIRDEDVVRGHVSIVYRAINNAAEFLEGLSRKDDLDDLQARADVLQRGLVKGSTLTLDIGSLIPFTYVDRGESKPVFGSITTYSTPNSERRMQGPSGTFRRQLRAYARRLEQDKL